MQGTSLADLAGDVAIVVERLAGGPAVLIGHAFGQRVARMLAMTRPDLVKAIVMLAAGGKVPVPERAREALWGCFDLALPDQVHIENVRYAFLHLATIRQSGVRAGIRRWLKCKGQPL